MHQALLVPEVLLEIFAHVNDMESKSCTTLRSTQKNFAALAVTCKAFYEHTMEFLWAEINQLEPLLGCVTRLHSLVYRSGIKWDQPWAKALEPLSAHEIRQFLRHSACIRTLSIVSDYPFHLISIILGSCVLPRLKSLTLSIKYLDFFLPHTLHRCHLLTFNGGLRSVVTRCATLEHLSICPPAPSVDDSTADELSLLSDKISRCTQLVTLHCPMLNWAAWMHLSYLPTLLSVRIEQEDNAHPYLPLEQDIVNFSPFLNITILSFELHSATYLITLMQHSQFPSLKDFRLVVSGLHSGEAEQLFNISVEGIPHLLCFKQLRFLHLYFFNACICLDDDILVEAMTAWSHISNLEIIDSCFHPSPVTLHKLFSTLHLCPQLEILRIAVDTTVIDIDPDDDPTYQHNILHALEFRTSEPQIENAETLALVVFTWLPHVDQVLGDSELWGEVNMHLTNLSAALAQECMQV
ncbi:hypothetical protein EDD22DRAFT_1001972 [Suillus occidentalis]|nr:hypothetical protein EDD22DRAFT_1001972 [Suillus occidentalis]